jgi:carboxyl-terminal processing protease
MSGFGEGQYPPGRDHVPGMTPSGGSQAALRWTLVGAMLLMVVGLAFGLGFGTRLILEDDKPVGTVAQASGGVDGAPDFRVLDEIYKALRDNYVDPDRIDAELMRTGAINGLINAVGDPHQVYLTKSQAEGSADDLKGEFDGIGATVDQKGGEIVIVSPIEDSPAMKAGVRRGDVIVTIDGQTTKGLTLQEAIRKIRGKRGTTVKIGVRHTDGKSEELSIVRDTIKQPSVKIEKPMDAQGNEVEDVAYVRITEFTARTPDELSEYLKSIKDKPYKGLIIDLRNNPGGYLTSVRLVAEQFMRNQTILIEQTRTGQEKRYTTSDKGLATDMKIAVLVNHNSASASEILAGSLRDNKRGVVLGETTLGKGTVNQYIDLPTDGGKVYVTIGRWLTPQREIIEGRGVKPDIEVRVADNENPDPREYFNSVMFRAVDLLRNGS